VHGVDVEGKRSGIEEELVALLGTFAALNNVPITYAGGVRSIEDLELVKALGQDKVDCTIGSALDCFGGDLSYTQVVAWHRAMS
jgi:phosphoribosylformimino-5-aminoimidazole carboxamide ribotide isomerase